MLVTSALTAPDANRATPDVMSSNGVTTTVTPYCLPNFLSRLGSKYSGKL